MIFKDTLAAFERANLLMSSTWREQTMVLAGHDGMRYGYLRLDLGGFLLLIIVFLRSQPSLLFLFEFSLNDGKQWIEVPLAAVTCRSKSSL